MHSTVLERTGGISSPADRHPQGRRSWMLGGGLAAIAVLILVAVACSLAIGTKAVPPADVWAALTDPGHGYMDTVVASRVPRTILGLLLGGSLAVAGVVVQGITRNPLGDPSILGVNFGAAAAIVTGIGFFGLGGAAGMVWIALPGAFTAVVVAYVLGSSGHGATPVRLVLAGAVVSAVLAAYIQAVTLSVPAAFESYRFWVIGSLAGRSPQTIPAVLPFLVVGLVVAFALARSLNMLALGDDTARALGARLGRTRVLGVIAATLLCAAATAAAGPIAFIGLAVPHVVRSVTGDDHRWLMPYSLGLGAVLLLAADIVGRIVVAPDELMVGVVTAFIGGPVLVLAVRRLRERS